QPPRPTPFPYTTLFRSDRLDQADAEQMGPYAIDCRAGKVGVVRRRNPVGQCHPRTYLELPLGLAAVEVTGLHHAVGAGYGDLARSEEHTSELQSRGHLV